MIDNHDPHQPQKTFFAALRVLRGQMCCRCRSPRPSVSSVEKGVAVAVLRGPPCPPWKKVLPLPFFAALRGPSWTIVLPLQFSAALRVLRGPVAWTNVLPLPLPFFAALRGPSWTNVLPLQFSAALRVLRGLRGPSWPFVEGVAVAVLRGPPCPPWTNVLPLPFSAALRVLRGQMCCRCRSSAALRGPSWTNVLPLQFSAALRVLRGQMCCRCLRSPWKKVRPSVSSADKCFAVAVLRGPSWPFVDKCFAVAVLRGPSWIDQTMTLQISVQKTVNEP